MPELSGRLSSLRELTLMRVRSFIREPEALFWTFGFPILLSIGLGLAFREESSPPPPPIAIEQGTLGESYLAPLAVSGEVRPILMDSTAAEAALRRGDVVLIIGGRAEPIFRFDPARPESREARLLTERALQAAAGLAPPLQIREDVERRPGGRYIDWVLPGLIGMNLMSTGLWGMGFGIVQARQKKQLKRMSSTPMRKRDFLLAQILARLVFIGLEVPPVVLFAWLAFGVTVQGSLLALTLVVLLGAMAFAGLGLLSAARVRTIEGLSGALNLVMLPMFVLSGVFFTASRFPDAIQPFVQALPLTALNDALRAVYNDALPVTAYAGELAILAAWMVATFLLSVRWFRWQ